MSFGLVALYCQQSSMLFATMFLMSSQSAFFSPCKYGIIPEQVPATGLSRANGMLQMATFLAIIAGMGMAPQLSLWSGQRFALAGTACLIVSVFGIATAFRIAPSPAHPARPLRFNGFANLGRTFGLVRRDGFLMLAILAAAVFSLAAAFIQLNILHYGETHLGLSYEASTHLFLLTAVGIGAGSVFAGRISGRGIEFGIVPVGAALMCLGLLVLGTLAPGNVALAACVMPVLGFAAGLFIVPLEAFVQFRAPGDRIGSVQAFNAFLSWVGILLASGLLFVGDSVAGWTAQQGFLVLAAGLLGLTVFSLWILPDFFAKFVVMLVTRFCYRLRVRGLDHLPHDGPALVVCNHVSLMDAVLLVSCQQRRIRMLMSRNFYDKAGWLTRRIVDLGKVILIQGDGNPKQLVRSLKDARAALDEGYLVCIFAEGALSRTGMTRAFKPGFERIVKGTGYPIVPAYIGGAWGSVARYRHGMPKIRPLGDFRYPVQIHFGAPLPSDANVFEVRQAVTALSGDAFDALENTRRSLGHTAVRAARANWRKLALADADGRELSFGKTLTGALVLRTLLRRRLADDETRVGIALPAGIGSCLANLALTLDRRTTVNLNYTAPAHAFRSAREQCGLRTVITSRKFPERLPELPFGAELIFLEDLLPAASRTDQLRAALAARFLPARQLTGESRHDADDIATILFSSGSTAEPKGVMLSHHNLLANIESFRSVLTPARDDVMLAALPHFHSFGYTVTFWFPLVSGLTAACHNNPLEGETIGRLARRYRASVLLTTPAFLLAYARKVRPEQFAALRYVFAGAEKLQPRVAGLFEKRFGIRPLEGYGATELAPVCAISLPDVEIDDLTEPGTREGRLGRPLPGVAVRIVHPETRAPLPPGEEGLIEVKGPNVMRGYLDKPGLTASVLRDGWYDTGDLGVMDPDGFFAVTGRLSRFSKIGGEMISHGAVEKALQEALGAEPGTLAVVAVEDERKGEKLHVLHTLGDPIPNLGDTLRKLGIPNLWKPNPKDWIAVDTLPVLGSGKLDYRRMKELAQQ